MKKSQTIGIVAAIATMAVCFLPWVYISSKQITVTGFQAIGTDFGKPGLFNMVMSIIMVVLFAIPTLWAKRTNLFVGSLNIAWSFRNFILLTTCMMGECPEKKPGLYLLLFLAVSLLLMTLLPSIPVKQKKMN